MTADYDPDRPVTSVSRRAFLKGLGATVALPFLESIPKTSLAGQGAPSGPPRRYLTMVFANGVHTDHWWAKGAGESMELGWTLEPLAPHRKDVTVLNGLHIFDRISGVHWPYFTNWLSGAPIHRSNIPDVAQTADQFLAEKIGDATPIPSLTLGLEPVLGGIRAGVPSVYFHTISWNSGKTPVPPEIYPRQAFDSLFDRSGLQRDMSVLDEVGAQAKDLRRDLSRDDQRKLDEYLDSIRDLEGRIDRTLTERPSSGWQPSLREPDLDRPAAGKPVDVREHMDLMLDILVLALQMDKTRIATMLFNSDGTYDMRFGFLDGVSNESMHVISHHGNKDSKLYDYKMINRFHVERLARVMDKMKKIDEGGSSLLDNSMILFGSTMFDGNKHDANTLPVLLAGRGGGTLTPGRVITYEKLEDRRLCNLHLAMIQRMGVRTDRFGNSHYPLPQLS